MMSGSGLFLLYNLLMSNESSYSFQEYAFPHVVWEQRQQ